MLRLFISAPKPSYAYQPNHSNKMVSDDWLSL